MAIDGTAFGSITIDGRTYHHDVVIRLSGKVVKRKKRLSKIRYGTSHVISKDEAKFVHEKGCEALIIGAGQYDSVRLSQEAAAFLKKKRCGVVVQPTPDAIAAFNRAHGRTVGLFHVTC